VNTPTVVDLTGVTTANLQTSLLAQLGGAGGNYTVAYDTTTGALSIGISATGSGAGITSIASSSNNSQETPPGGASTNIFTSDGSIGSSFNVTAGALTTASVGRNSSGAGQDLSATNLTSQSSAQAALAKINIAISDVAFQRGTIGANINTLTAVGNVMTTQSTNTMAAENDVTATDYGQATSNMSKYQILSQTGIAALSQANQAQQMITKLLQ
jgi:flagellin